MGFNYAHREGSSPMTRINGRVTILFSSRNDARYTLKTKEPGLRRIKGGGLGWSAGLGESKISGAVFWRLNFGCSHSLWERVPTASSANPPPNSSADAGVVEGLASVDSQGLGNNLADQG